METWIKSPVLMAILASILTALVDKGVISMAVGTAICGGS